jgi:hypothetical protein
MELIERYLQAVKFWLPEAQKEDIAAELSEELDAQIAEREVALGRPVDEAELEVILKKMGRPVVVANRYLPAGYLIGPALFPVYGFVLKVALAATMGPLILTWMGLAMFAGDRVGSFWARLHLGPLWGSLWTAAFATFAAVTIIFAVLERAGGSKLLDNWSPCKLPAVRHPNLIPRSSAVFELAINLGMLVFWAVSLRTGIVTFIPGLTITFNPVWMWFYWGFLLSATGTTALAAVGVWRPYWTTARAWVRLAVDAFGSAMFVWLMRANVVAGFDYTGATAQKSLEIAQAINMWSMKLSGWGFILGVMVVLGNAYRIWQLRRRQGVVGNPAALGV